GSDDVSPRARERESGFGRGKPRVRGPGAHPGEPRRVRCPGSPADLARGWRGRARPAPRSVGWNLAQWRADTGRSLPGEAQDRPGSENGADRARLRELLKLLLLVGH